jgi:hypothetical protein
MVFVDRLHGIHDVGVSQLVGDLFSGEKNHVAQAQNACERALVIQHGQTPRLRRAHGVESGVNIILGQAEEHFRQRAAAFFPKDFRNGGRFVSGVQNRTPFTMTSWTFLIQVLAGAEP